MDAPRTARTMWKLFEPLHALTYFADECAEEYTAAGLKGFWMGYFGGRSAPMGAVGPAVVDATFFSFNPERVARALPDAWWFAAPDRVLEARLAGVDRALGRILGPDGVGADHRFHGRRPGPRRRTGAHRASRGSPSTAVPWPPPTSRCTGPKSPTWPCGRRPQCCASTAATGTSWRWWRRGSTAARRSSPWPPPVRCRGRCSRRRGVGTTTPGTLSAAELIERGWLREDGSPNEVGEHGPPGDRGPDRSPGRRAMGAPGRRTAPRRCAPCSHPLANAIAASRCGPGAQPHRPAPAAVTAGANRRSEVRTGPGQSQMSTGACPSG